MKDLIMLNSVLLTAADNIEIDSLLSRLIEQYGLPSNPSFLLKARIYANQLPVQVLNKLNSFRLQEDHNGTFLIKGFRIDDHAVGCTPYQTGKEVDEQSGLREGFMLMLLVSFIGDAFGWENQREGALINNVIPLRNHEHEQLSTGSIVDLDWHTEEAFHDCRADFLTLMCIRNPDQIPTLIGSVQDIDISNETKAILFQPRFIFLTDKNFVGDSSLKPSPVLFGNFDNPYIKIDPSFMQSIPGDMVAKKALNEIITSIGNTLHEQALEQGDILFIDNYRVVHGRKGFQPRFDGTDRWLKRINVTLDLRKSRASRSDSGSRIIITN